ncbi:hypothetical protein NGRA_1734 [Nosema granulosis]|uniref:Uncharacterized protein n=1 Tax=Nosema granulosis TaxID=83296 RepID=A0A9P6KZ35_9MICR|nr:hypothetical protein NGRA_1734 [Nosema granulosis]
MLKVAIVIIVVIILVLVGMWFWGFFGESVDSPFSKDGKKINELELDSAIKSLKKNNFKQSDDDIKNILAISYIYAGMKEEDLKSIVESLKKDTKKESTKEGEKSGENNSSKKDTNKDSTKDTNKSTGGKDDLSKIEKLNKAFKNDVFAKDGVDKVLAEDYKNKQVKNLLLSLKDSSDSSKLKSKVPSYDKIIAKYKVTKIDKDSKNLSKQAESVLACFIAAYEKIINGTECK